MQTLDTFFNLSTWVTAIVGAVVLFLLVSAVRGRTSRFGFGRVVAAGGGEHRPQTPRIKGSPRETATNIQD